MSDTECSTIPIPQRKGPKVVEEEPEDEEEKPEPEDVVLLGDADGVASFLSLVKEHRNYDAPLIHHLAPWLSLVKPGYTSPRWQEVLVAKCKTEHCSQHHITPTLKGETYCSLSTKQAHAILGAVIRQLLATKGAEPFVIDWDAVSAASGATVSVCREFWWSFDIDHLLDEEIGLIIPATLQYKPTIDEAYYNEVNNRARMLARQQWISQENILDDGNVILKDSRVTSHVINVLHATPGKKLKVGIVNGIIGTAELISINSNEATLRLGDEFKSQSSQPQPPNIDLVIGIPRPKSLDKVLQYTASMGVGRIYLLCSSRVQQCYLTSHQLQPTEIAKSLLLGMEQGGTTYMPQVQLFESLGQFQRFLREKKYLSLIAHPDTSKMLGSFQISKNINAPILVAIGPEGGWLDHEVEFFIKLGFQSFSLGPAILRTEVACVAVLAQVHLLLQDTCLSDNIEYKRGN